MNIDLLLKMNIKHFYECAFFHDQFRITNKYKSIDELDLSIRILAVVKNDIWYELYMIQPTSNDSNKVTMIFKTYSEPRRKIINSILNDIHYSITPTEKKNYNYLKLMRSI